MGKRQRGWEKGVPGRRNSLDNSDNEAHGIIGEYEQSSSVQTEHNTYPGKKTEMGL